MAYFPSDTWNWVPCFPPNLNVSSVWPRSLNEQVAPPTGHIFMQTLTHLAHGGGSHNNFSTYNATYNATQLKLLQDKR